MGEFECVQMTRKFQGDGIDTYALKPINLKFKAGNFVSVIGPSGSGKSTLLSLLGTLDVPTSGTLSYDGHELSQLNAKELANFRFEKVGFIFQQFHLIPTLTAVENVMAPLFGRKVDYDKKERALSLLARVGLREKAESLPSQLSGGQQQRVAVARALIHEPEWLLADEPTGNLDSETGEVIFELLRELNEEKGCGVICVTHDPSIAERADVQVRMKDGAIIEVIDTRVTGNA
ncbi:ABC transporter ATP-binding protein [Exiguobacterium alkaliphilum]|uniref:ABC transporter ATP-binding protein n=1 Tax=Exiguobacterium alkaliphilum TaxID=1428684 RepID=A0ABT2KYD7_9BACL|nr:ABC transporter ATP-binding protein [Exiguobacterium alkaliphilum]MCT4795311.1 ABC transporter ATP-binding protein [Exiguobacterium alkaliphilum]